VVQERYERLVALQERITLEESRAQVGRTVDVLLAEGEGRKDGESRRLSGRADDNRLVHLSLPEGLAPADAPRPGDLVTVEVTHAAPHHLVADSALTGGTFAVRRTRAGDAWDRAQRGEDDHAHGGAGDACGTGGGAGGPAAPVLLGLPTIGLGRA
jgi:tRNA-2-methylthio-N6-dimethylallyladenosine synthase